MRSFRIFLTTLVMLACAGTVFAQKTYSPEFYIGAHGGATLAKQSFSPGAPQSFLPGCMFGVTAKYTEENHFGIIGELNFAQRGWKEKFEGTSFRYSHRLDYMQLALMTHVFFGSKKFRGFLNAGPEAAVLLGNSVSANFDYNDISTIPGFPIKNRENRQLAMKVSRRFDYGITAGLGGEWNITPRNVLVIEGRFYYGLGNIFPAAKKDVFGASHGMAIEVLAGYRFRIK